MYAHIYAHIYIHTAYIYTHVYTYTHINATYIEFKVCKLRRYVDNTLVHKLLYL